MILVDMINKHIVEGNIMNTRRFKFRAWNSKKNKWQHREPCDIMGEMILLGGWMAGVRLIELNDIIVMQSTDLFDKKEQEIFEGDIVQADGYNPALYIVEYIEGGFCCTYKKNYININHFYPSTGCQLEIVGNIFDNAEQIQ